MTKIWTVLAQGLGFAGLLVGGSVLGVTSVSAAARVSPYVCERMDLNAVRAQICQGSSSARITLVYSTGTKVISNYTESGRLLDFHVDSTDRKFSASEKAMAISALEESEAELLRRSPLALRFLQFNAEMLPVGEVVPVFASAMAPEVSSLHRGRFRRPNLPDAWFPSLPDYTMICDWIGHDVMANHTAAGNSYQNTVRVGDRDQECRGRCGAGCDRAWYVWSRQYTQECLNHDVCNDTVGTQLGECQDEWIAASGGYMSAPNCENAP